MGCSQNTPNQVSETAVKQRGEKKDEENGKCIPTMGIANRPDEVKSSEVVELKVKESSTFIETYGLIFQKCPKGHSLASDYGYIYPLGMFRCEICGRELKPQPLPKRCSECSYDICNNCYNGKLEKVAEHVKCSKSHPLVFSTFVSEDFGIPTQPYTYECKLCKTEGRASDGRWYCRLCCYNVCPKCGDKKT